MGGIGANTTDPTATSVHGTNPQYLVEKITRVKIYDCRYWKEHCFALTAETIVDKAIDLQFVGGSFGGNRMPSEFLCLMLKMLQLQPEKDIIIEFITNEDYKYVRVLGAFYLRLVGRSVDIYKYLEPLLNDYRKIRMKNVEGKFVITHVDEIIDALLHDKLYFDIQLPRLLIRRQLEDNNMLTLRQSALEDLDNLDLEEEIDVIEPSRDTALVPFEDDKKEDDDRHRRRSRSRSRSRTRSRSRERRRDRDRDRDRDRRRDRDRDYRRRSRSRSRSRSRRRSRSRSRNRRRDRSRSRDRRRRSPSRDRTAPVEESSSSKKKGSKSLSWLKGSEEEKPKSKKKMTEADEIAMWNEERRKLGLKPLRK